MAVRELKRERLDADTIYVEFAGKTADTKPTGNFATGSKFFNIQTGKTYYYDEKGSSGSEWIDPTAS